MNRKQDCDFNVDYKGETFHIFQCWRMLNGEVAFYDGEIVRDGVRFEQSFYPSDLEIPPTF